MTLDRPQHLERRARTTHHAVVNRQHNLTHDVERGLGEDRVVRGGDAPGERVLHRQHARISIAIGDAPRDLAILATWNGFLVDAEHALNSLFAERAELTLKSNPLRHAVIPAKHGSAVSGGCRHAPPAPGMTSLGLTNVIMRRSSRPTFSMGCAASSRRRRLNCGRPLRFSSIHADANAPFRTSSSNCRIAARVSSVMIRPPAT